MQDCLRIWAVMNENKNLLQKNINRFVIAVLNARWKRQPNPIRGRADSRQTTWSGVVTGSEGSSPCNLVGKKQKDHFSSEKKALAFDNNQDYKYFKAAHFCIMLFRNYWCSRYQPSWNISGLAPYQ